jgi:ATP-dependent DNA helicase PIF1
MHSISRVAGTGKSVLLRQIISWARRRRDTDATATAPTDVAVPASPDVAVTASTGMAAVNIGGVTLHSWAGIGLGNGDAKEYVKTIIFGPGYWKKVRERWREVKTLIIDESNVRFFLRLMCTC